MTMKIEQNGKVNFGNHRFNVIAKFKKKIVVEIFDDSKFHYENGHRTVKYCAFNEKNKTFKLNRIIWDCTEIFGIKESV